MNSVFLCVYVNGLGETSQLYILGGSNCLYLHACIAINLEQPGSEWSPCIPGSDYVPCSILEKIIKKNQQNFKKLKKETEK